jgi:hypothetical protein
MSEGWLCIDEDSPQLEQHIAESVATAVEFAKRFMEEENVTGTEAERERFLTRVANLVEAKQREAIEKARAQAKLAGHAPPALH